MVKCFLFGDSHTRSYNDSFKIIPLFLGPGSSIGLDGAYFTRTYKLIKDVLNKNIIDKEDIIIINIGCPDILRYVFSHDGIPHKTYKINQWDKIIDKNINIEIIDSLIEKYNQIIELIKTYNKNVYILSATTSFYPILDHVIMFNNKLEDKYKSKFINLFQHTITGSDIKKVKKEFLNFNFKNETKYSDYKNYEYDPLHLNNSLSINLQVYIEKFIYNDIDSINKINLFDNKLLINDFNCYKISN